MSGRSHKDQRIGGEWFSRNASVVATPSVVGTTGRSASPSKASAFAARSVRIGALDDGLDGLSARKA